MCGATPAPQRRPQGRQSPCCLGAVAELGSGGGLSPLGALIPTGRTWMRKLWAGEKGLQPQGPQRHAAHPAATHSCTLWPYDSSPDGTQGPRDGCAGSAPPERGREGPRVPHPSPRSSIPPAQPPPQMRWDKATQTEGHRGLLPPWLLSLGELQAPMGLGTGWLGAGGRGGKGLPGQTQQEARRGHSTHLHPREEGGLGS